MEQCRRNFCNVSTFGSGKALQFNFSKNKKQNKHRHMDNMYRKRKTKCSKKYISNKSYNVYIQEIRSECLFDYLTLIQ